MTLQKLATAAGGVAANAYDGVKQFVKLERGLAVFLAATPFLLIGFDTWDIRPSISAYYDMEASVAFYVPFTVAAMLFVVNGVLKHKHFYNIILGVALFGIIVLNHDDFRIFHFGFVFVFFVGNAVVILLSETRALSKIGILVAALLLFFTAVAFDGWKVFWLEWASLAVIATNYVLDTVGKVRYKALA